MFDKLKETRLNEKITCEQLANLLGFKTKGAYHKKEQGSVPFTLEEAKIISDYFNKGINEIFFENEVSQMKTISKSAQNTGDAV